MQEGGSSGCTVLVVLKELKVLPIAGCSADLYQLRFEEVRCKSDPAQFSVRSCDTNSRSDECRLPAPEYGFPRHTCCVECFCHDLMPKRALYCASKNKVASVPHNLPETAHTEYRYCVSAPREASPRSARECRLAVQCASAISAHR